MKKLLTTLLMVCLMAVAMTACTEYPTQSEIDVVRDDLSKLTTQYDAIEDSLAALEALLDDAALSGEAGEAIAKLNATLGTFAADADTVVKQLGDLKAELATLSESMPAGVPDLTEELTALTTKVTAIETNFDSRVNALITTALTPINTAIGALEGDVSGLESDLSAAAADLENLIKSGGTIEGINTAISNLNTALGTATGTGNVYAQLAALTTNLGNLSTTVGGMSGQAAAISTLQGKVAALEADFNATLKGKIDATVAAAVKVLNDKVFGADGNGGLQKELNDKIAAVGTDLDTAELALDNLVKNGGTIAQINTAINNINDLLGTATGTGNVYTQLATLTINLGTLSTTVSGMSGQAAAISTLQGKVAALEDNFNSRVNTLINAALGPINTAISTLEDDLGDLTGRVVTAETAITELNKAGGTIAGINTEITNINGEITSIKSAASTLSGTVSGLDSALATLTTTVGTNNTTLSSLIDSLTTRVGTLESGIATINATLAGIDARISTAITNALNAIAAIDAYVAELAADVMDCYSAVYSGGFISEEVSAALFNKANYYAYYILRAQTQAVADARYEEALETLESLAGEWIATISEINEIYASLDELDYTTDNWNAILAIKSAYLAAVKNANDIGQIPNTESVIQQINAIDSGWKVSVNGENGLRFATIHAAVAAANDGDTVTVTEGTYVIDSIIEIRKNIIFVAEGLVTITDNDQLANSLNGLIYLYGSDSDHPLIVDGFTLISATKGYRPGNDNGIVYITSAGVGGSSGSGKAGYPIIVRNCTMRSSDAASKANGVDVSTDTLQRRVGVLTDHGSGSYIVIENNNLSHLAYGMYFNNINNAVITGNTISDTRVAGIIASGREDNIFFDITISDNTLTNVGYEAFGEGWYAGISVWAPQNGGIVIENNDINSAQGNMAIYTGVGDIDDAQALSEANNNCSVQAGNDYYNVNSNVALLYALENAVDNMTIVLAAGEFNLGENTTAGRSDGNAESETIQIVGNNVTLRGAGKDQDGVYLTKVLMYKFLTFYNDMTVEGIAFSDWQQRGAQGAMFNLGYYPASLYIGTATVTDCYFYTVRCAIVQRGGEMAVDNCEFYGWDDRTDPSYTGANAIQMVQVDRGGIADITNSLFDGVNVKADLNKGIADSNYTQAIWALRGGKLGTVTGNTFTNLTWAMTLGYESPDDLDFTPAQIAALLTDNTFVAGTFLDGEPLIGVFEP